MSQDRYFYKKKQAIPFQNGGNVFNYLEALEKY